MPMSIQGSYKTKTKRGGVHAWYPLIERKFTLHSAANALTIMVLPQPDGPYNRIPLGRSICHHYRNCWRFQCVINTVQSVISKAFVH